MTDRPRLAYRHSPGRSPTVVFLPGYASAMSGTKALALEGWARASGQAFLRMDYAGCGESEGMFADQTLTDWLGDVLAAIDELVEGPVVLVGSSLGGWLMLLAARARADRVAGLVGVAVAADFTDWGFTADEKLDLLREGALRRPNPYGPEPTLYTRVFWQSGEANRVLGGGIAFDGPVRLLHGQRDAEVPWHHSTHLAGLLTADDVQTWLIKDGDHRLSRDRDLALLIGAVDDVIGTISAAQA